MSLRAALAAPLLLAAFVAQAQVPAGRQGAAPAYREGDPFDPAISLAAPLAYMVDLGSGRVLFEREARRRFIPASLTKIMTAYVAFELMQAGRVQPNQRFAMSDAAFRQWHQVGSTMFLGRGQVVSVDELLQAIMTVSANDGCIVLAEGASGSVAGFVALMNAEARKLGMTDSHFGSPNGWPDQGATYTTARDLAILTQAMLTRHPGYYSRYVGHPEMTFNGIRQDNHVPLFGRVPGADGVKTGFTNEAGYGLVGSAVRDGRRLVMVVGGYDRAWQRARESRAMLEWGFSAWKIRRLFAAGATVGEAQVQGGAARHVALTAPMPYYLTYPAGAAPPAVKLTLRYDGPLRAPIRKGAQVAMLRVGTPGEAPRDLPLMAGASTGVAGPMARLRNGLLGLAGL
ncbi:D-alanyl-D-alanine carboxypeptidase family protein [Novosphingobium sp. Gsoil 351]|uniref:D-alanyl-D-alanine carboxypeptidase family protein n=1 Tax=Novosphingobium sp. Gsoil 351 TaxID=2675225 RepID=UPI0012B4C962|nr:D-alanyl-D-alanine carboxypeptidase family protein [Novosphingobium sp. Gsoil 351]QGN53343.1 D-alanyl-D-alanine carboxypeptidase [Novosphingobium sp. Gsoil 351]